MRVIGLLTPICIAIVMGCLPTASVAQSKLKEVKKTQFGVGLRSGSTLFNFHTTCVSLRAYFISDKFFDGLRGAKTASGMQFTKDGVLLQTFPDHVWVDVEAIVWRCPARLDQIVPGYGEGFMSETSFQLAWKTSFGEHRQVVPTSIQEQHPRPSLRWDYFLEVPAKDVPLTNSLIIGISFRRDTAHAQLPANLGWSLGQQR